MNDVIQQGQGQAQPQHNYQLVNLRQYLRSKFEDQGGLF
jgi:hypothetical protein